MIKLKNEGKTIYRGRLVNPENLSQMQNWLTSQKDNKDFSQFFIIEKPKKQPKTEQPKE